MATPGICRTGDTFSGTCYNHSPYQAFIGTWTAGSTMYTAEGLEIIRVGDTAHASCGHTARATAGSTATVVGGIAVHRVGDAIDILEGSHGIGTSTSGSTVITAV